MRYKLTKLLILSFFIKVFILSTYTLSFSQISITDVESSLLPNDGAISHLTLSSVKSKKELVAVLKTPERSQVNLISLSDCNEDSRFIFNNHVGAATLDGNLLWVASDENLLLLDVDNGTILHKKNYFNDTIKSLKVSINNKLILFWGNDSVAIIRYSGSNTTLNWSYNVTFPISDVSSDEKLSTVFIAGYDGSFVVADVNSEHYRFFDLQIPIMHTSYNDSSKMLYMGTQDGLIVYDTRKDTFTRLSNRKVEYVAVANDNKVVYVTKNMINIYSSQENRTVKSFDVNGVYSLLVDNGIIIYSFNNTITLYDMQKDITLGDFYISQDGYGYFLSTYYYGNSHFTDMITTSPQYYKYSKDKMIKDKSKACINISNAFKLYDKKNINNQDKAKIIEKPVEKHLEKPIGNSSLVAPIEKPNNISMNNANTTGTNNIKEKVSGANKNDLDSAKVSTNISSVSSPTVSDIEMQILGGSAAPKAGNTYPIDMNNVTSQSNTSPNKVEKSETLLSPELSSALMSVQESDVPEWLLNPSKLPEYSAVTSGVDGKVAMDLARIKIREDVARAFMKRMLTIDTVKQISDDTVRKRFLWMVGGEVGQLASDYAIQKDLWVAPDKKVYILSQVLSSTVEQVYNAVFQKELNLLNLHGEAEYLKQKPYKWE